MTDTLDLPGVHQAPNIQTDPAIYEIENRALDPERKLEAAMQSIAPWEGKIVLDLGAGTGFFVERFHQSAGHVIAVEPHGPSRLLAMARLAERGLERASVMTGSAERLLLPDASVDICHARFAYFFGPGCEPGLAELARVMRPGGAAFIIDNDLRNGTFASWLRRFPDQPTADAVENFWAERGWALSRIESEWRFESRADLEAVVRLEFGDKLAPLLLAEHEGTSVDYHYALYHRRF
ncbi:MAG TPA: class I SAM-dependent methyltransferase [Herpetosiphonaceae bacterium]